MKVTKEELIEKFNKITGKWEIDFTDGKDLLTLAFDDFNMTVPRFENVVGWLEHITFTRHNKILITSKTSLNGEIRLIDVLSNNTMLSLLDSKLERTLIEEGGPCEIKGSRLDQVTIKSGPNVINNSVLHGCLLQKSKIIRGSIGSDGPDPKLHVSDSEIFNAVLSVNSGMISNRKISSVSITVPHGDFDGRYFSIDNNGAALVGYCNGQEKIIVIENKRYNLGSWEEQFVTKENNFIIKMMNQKKLEIINMFFDTLAFK